MGSPLTAHAFCALEPAAAADWFSNTSLPWWIAGGWALDLFIGRGIRAHNDLDVGVLRRDIGEILRVLAGWDVFEAHKGTLTRLPASARPRAGVNGLWCRPAGAQEWHLELLLDESEGDFWVFRRDTRIRRPFSAILRKTDEGIPYLSPEIQLLYKAKSMRERDQQDFEHVCPLLDTLARAWLRNALALTHPEHAWIRALD